MQNAASSGWTITCVYNWTKAHKLRRNSRRKKKNNIGVIGMARSNENRNCKSRKDESTFKTDN